MALKNKNETRQKRHIRVRKRVNGSEERPRLNVYRSTNHIYVQVVNDAEGKTLAAASSLEKALGIKSGGNIDAAKSVGAAIAQRAQAAGVTKVVFDRGGYLYHGRVAALADAAREAGLQF